jgi:hypothetical protein
VAAAFAPVNWIWPKPSGTLAPPGATVPLLKRREPDIGDRRECRYVENAELAADSAGPSTLAVSYRSVG